MVRSPSAVTLIKQRPVAGPSVSTGVSKAAPMPRISRAYSSPGSSPATLPTKTERPPKLATPATVLAAEPPEVFSPWAIRA